MISFHFEARPLDALAFDHVDLQTFAYGHFDGASRDFAITIAAWPSPK